ncbi:MAG: HAMP domain-containing histidine kinase [Ignavibacteriales bacterium]|nr:HAMP domain-containing histidine kinase [Ignavibacteriales bacterium]
MMSINNDQTNLLRQVFKNQSVPEEKKERAIETILYEELSRVNNELVNMQRELAKKNNELIGLNKVKNQFLGMAAHDLRNPLGVIMNLSEIILDEEDQLSEESISFLKKIDYLANFMLNMVTELLDISSIEAGSMTLNKTNFDIVTLIRDSVSLNKPLADKKS